jgi:hypothetical protein
VRLASQLEARPKLLQLSLVSCQLSVVSLFTSVQSSRSNDQCVVLITTHKELECRDIIFYYMEHIVLQI